MGASLAQLAVTVATWCAVVAIVSTALALVAVLLVRRFVFPRVTDPRRCTLAFFHPYCNAAGGGERVLWCAIQALNDAPDRANFRMVVYTGDVGVSGAEILARARERFGLAMPDDLDLEFVYVKGRRLLEAARYPRFTMLGQSVGSMLLAWECLRAYTPDVWVDTTGCHFTMGVAKVLAGCSTACYVHYPTITTDMLARVWDRRPLYNNDAAVAASAALSLAKAAYYNAFAAAYFVAGGFADAVMVNSSWTQGHIDALWGLPRHAQRAVGGGSGGGGGAPVAVIAHGVMWPLCRAVGLSATRPASRLVYPPCNTDTLAALPLERAPLPGDDAAAGPGGGGGDGGQRRRRRLVVSVAQFRPEKDHELQLRAFAAFRARGGPAVADVRLLLIGGCRDEGDARRVDALRALAAELGLSGGDGGDGPAPVEFVLNAPLPALVRALGAADAALHTMWNEHFGISVVEAMAAGALPIAHASGGPRADIVVPLPVPGASGSGSGRGGGPGGDDDGAPPLRRPGFLAATVDEYADALAALFALPETERAALAAAGRAHARAEFSDERFQMGVYRTLLPLVRDGLDAARERRRADAEARSKRGERSGF